MVDRDRLATPGPSTVLETRRYRTQMVLAAAQARGWEAEGNPAKPSRWWLPGTRWRLHCASDKCTIYRIAPHGRGNVETRTYWLTEVKQIIARLGLLTPRETA